MPTLRLILLASRPNPLAPLVGLQVRLPMVLHLAVLLLLLQI